MEAESEDSAYPLANPPAVETGVSACRDDGPAAVWAALAPLIAGRPRVRESRDGGKNYHGRWERPLTSRLPRVPAAVPIYTADGCARTLVFDLDTSKGGRGAVLRDAAAITDLVARCGGEVFCDESPSGGIHVYVPFTDPIPFHDARDLALALAARTPSMDPTPNTNLLHGLIRPPGAAHKTGGHQTLRGTLAAAYTLARTGNRPEVWTALSAALADDITAAQHVRTGPTDAEAASPIERASGPRELTGTYLTMATTGTWDAGRYASPSEARQAIVTSAAWAGHSLPQIAARIKTGTWPGLAALYARYRPGARHKALTRDWTKARALIEKHQASTNREGGVRKSHTSEPTSHRRLLSPRSLATESNRATPGEFQYIREWWAALLTVEHDRYTGRAGPAVRMVLRALGEAGMKTGSRYVAFGTRSVALATGLDHSTVAAHLRTLRDEDDPLVALVEADRGLQGDLYELRMPDAVADRAARAPWRAGKIQALRPAFRELGLPAAYVYEALESATEHRSSFELAKITRLARSTVYEALETLAAYNLAEQVNGRWRIVAATSLTQIAEWLGCVADIEAQLTCYRIERAAWRAVLGGAALLVETIVVDHDHGLAPWPAPPPPDGKGRAYSVIDLLQERLGARVLPEPATIGGTP